MTQRERPAEAYERATALAERRRQSLNRLFQDGLALLDQQEREKRLYDDASAIVHTRVPARRLPRAEKILQKLGLTPDDAVNLLLPQIEIRQGLPFEVSMHP